MPGYTSNSDIMSLSLYMLGQLSWRFSTVYYTNGLSLTSLYGKSPFLSHMFSFQLLATRDK